MPVKVKRAVRLHLWRGPGPADGFQQNGEADPSEDQSHGQRQQDPCVESEGHDVVCVEREAGVVEPRHRMEYPLPRRPAPGVAVGGAEPQCQCQGDHGLDDEAEGHRRADHPGHVAEMEAPALGGGTEAPAQTQPPREQESEEGGQRHEPQTADLNQQQDGHLPHRRPVRGGVHGDQAGEADGGRGGEEGVEKRGGAPVDDGPGGGQDGRAHGDDQQKSQRHRNGGPHMRQLRVPGDPRLKGKNVCF